MPRYWFDVFTRSTWEEARAIDFTVSGFSTSKLATVRRVQPGDVLICYLKGEKGLIGALKVTGSAYVAQEPRIWESQVFPVRLPAEPFIILDDEHSLDFLTFLPSMSFYNADNMRSTWARLQGSPTALTEEDGQVLLDALLAAVADRSDSKDGAERELSPELPQRHRPKQPQITLVDPVDALVQELQDAQRDTAQPARFERAIARAFHFLGLDVCLQGQSGTTDVVVESRLGLESFRVVVDAKSSRSGKVSEAHINWAAIADHRNRAAADYAMVVGESFAGGNLKKFAGDFGVSLLDVDSLTTVVRLHNETPFSASDLRELFATSGTIVSVMADLKQKNLTTIRHWQLVSEVVRLVDGFSRSCPPVTPTLGHLHGALMGVYFVDRDPDQPPGSRPSEQDVLDAVGFLASRPVGILRPVTPAETAGYRLALSPHAALQRLRAMESTICGMLATVGGDTHQTTASFDAGRS